MIRWIYGNISNVDMCIYSHLDFNNIINGKKENDKIIFHQNESINKNRGQNQYGKFDNKFSKINLNGNNNKQFYPKLKNQYIGIPQNNNLNGYYLNGFNFVSLKFQ